MGVGQSSDSGYDCGGQRLSSVQGNSSAQIVGRSSLTVCQEKSKDYDIVLLFACITGKLYCHGLLRDLNASSRLGEAPQTSSLVRKKSRDTQAANTEHEKVSIHNERAMALRLMCFVLQRHVNAKLKLQADMNASQTSISKLSTEGNNTMPSNGHPAAASPQIFS